MGTGWTVRTLRFLAWLGALWLLTSPKPWNALFAFAPIPPILFGLFLLAAFLLREPLARLYGRLNQPSDRVFLAVAVGSSFALSSAANAWVLDQVPHVTDSVAYLFQAKALVEGYLAAPLPPLPEFFLAHFFYEDQGRMISLFQPGWPLVLALGVLLGLPHLVNPLLGALLLIPTYRIARREFGAPTARLGILILILSPFHLFMSADFMSHPLSALLSLLALDLALARSSRGPKPGGSKREALRLGAYWGLLFLTRAYNALLLALPLAVALWPTRRDRALALVLPGLLLGVALQLAFNAHLTGRPFTFPQDVYFALTEEKPNCHRLGFGDDIGCRMEHGVSAPARGYGPAEALKTTQERTKSLGLNFLGVPWALWIMLLPLWIGPLALAGRAGFVHVASLLFGYALFYYHGNCYGPRFLFEGVGFMAVFTALGLARLDAALTRAGDLLPSVRRLWRALLPALGLTLIVFALGWLHPKLWQTYLQFRGVDARQSRIAQAAGLTEGIVLLPGNDLTYSNGFIFNDPDFRNPLLYAIHHGPMNAQLFWAFPDREIYRFEPRRGRLVKLKRVPFEGVIYSEVEAKLPPLRRRGGFAQGTYIDQWRPDNRDAAQAYFDPTAPGASFTIRQEVFEEGDYWIELWPMRGPFLGDFRVSVNALDLEPDFRGYAPDYDFTVWRSDRPVHLPKGPSEFTFTSTGRHPDAKGAGIGLDALILRRDPDGLTKPLPKLEDEGYLVNGRLILIGPAGIPKDVRRWGLWNTY